jgi:hypothetical protein
VTITDPTGLSRRIDFSLPVANVPPIVNAGRAFDDPNSPIGTSGQGASHTYSMPSGAAPYTAAVTVKDNDGATGTNTVQVTVLKRGTTRS